MDIAPKLPALTLDDCELTIDGITGHGASRAVATIMTPGGDMHSAHLTREALIAFALELLALSSQMVEEGAYSTSDTVRRGVGAVSRRHADGVKRYYRIRDRMPVLQLAQRVLETSDDKTANTLLALLVHVEATGALPIKVNIDFKAAQESGGNLSQNDDSGSTQH